MTEAEWLACDDPSQMLDLLRGKASDRKLRLFGCAVCLRMGYRIGLEGVEALSVAERFADGQADVADLVIADAVLERKQDGISLRQHFRGMPAICLLTDIGERHGFRLLTRFAEQFDGASLLQDIFGNPYRTVTFTPAWRTETVVALATGIYAERAFDRMPILADALEEAGCDNADILRHCRGDGPHVRGCWVIDLVLGKG